MGLLSALDLQPPGAPSAVKPAGPPAAANEFADAGGGGGAVDKSAVAFQTARDAMQKVVDGVAAHAQKVKMKTGIDALVAKLKEADDHAAKKEWKEASAALAPIRTMAAAAKKLGDDWSNYAARRAATMAIILSFKTTPNSVKTDTDTVKNTADAAANQLPPDFVTALATLKALDDAYKPSLVTFVADLKSRLKKVEALDAKLNGYLKPAIDIAKPLVLQSEKAFNDKEFALCRQAGISSLRVLGPAERRAARRSDFDAARAAAVKAIASVRAVPAVADRAKTLDALLAGADSLASVTVLKIEEGTATLLDLKKRADFWLAAARTIASAASERKAGEGELAALDSHVAAARIGTERAAIRKLLADARNVSSVADVMPDPGPGWNSALTQLTRARADAVLAKKLADSFGPAAAAEAAAGKPADLAALQKALDKLRIDGKLAGKGANAAAADAEFKRFEAQVALVDKGLVAKDGNAAAAALTAAAAALVAAKTIQAEHGQFQATLASVEAQLKMLRASPRAVQIKARIAPVEAGLTAARAADQAKKGTEAMAAVRGANDAVAAATRADREREAHDIKAKAVTRRIAAEGKDAAAKTAFDKSVADATKLADALRFADASSALEQVEVALDKVKLQDLMGAASPKMDKITELAKAMSAHGGAKTIDRMIHDIPDGGSVQLLSALATGRYGVKFTAGEKISAAGDPAKAMKLVCDMFATLPQDVVGNKSITSVAYGDLETAKGVSAGHSYASGAVTMKGRAGVNQAFGSALVAKGELPAAAEDKYKPSDETTPLDFISFAAAHEVGHGVDEERGFMRRNGTGPEYGGWITFGGNLQPLADAIGASARFAGFYKTPAQKQYVLDKLQSKELNPPAAAPGTAAFNAKRAFDGWHDTATADNVYRSDSKSQSLKLDDGNIYHEAYARVWVGYRADARAKGLTGYQFRAPGEWFAELYAGWKSKRLKPNHPAVVWLQKL